MNLVIDDAVEQVHPPINGAAAAAAAAGGGPVQENRNVWQDGARLGMVVSSVASLADASEDAGQSWRGLADVVPPMSLSPCSSQVVRGNSVSSVEGLEAIKTT